MKVHYLMVKKYYFQLLSLVKQYYFKRFSFAQIRSLNIKTVLFQVIQFSINTQFSSISFIERSLSGVTTSGLSGPGSDGNQGVVHIPKSCSMTRTSPSDCLVSYPVHSLRGSYPSGRMQSVYFTGPADWAIHGVKCKTSFISDDSG